MPNLIHCAYPPLKFIPQRFNPIIYYIARGLLPLLLRLRILSWLPAGIGEIETINLDVLVNLYQKFQDGKTRFLMAFRHPEVDDPLCMMYLFSYAIPKTARSRSGHEARSRSGHEAPSQNISLKYPIHSHFLYDRGMTLWAGDWLGWLFSCLGGVSIHRGKRMDLIGLRTARDLFVNGKLPIMVAPEGATNGHSEIVSTLEPGVAQLGFWCVEDLVKANRSEDVVIVPIGIQYCYINPNWAKLDWLLGKLERDCGLPVRRINKSHLVESKEILYERLISLGEHILSEMEWFYRRFNHQDLPVTKINVNDSSINRNQLLKTRLEALLDTGLKTAEEYFGLPAQGTVIDRCRQLEEASWKDIYQKELSDLHAISPLKQGLADWIATEASLRMLHMRLVESFVAVTGSYVKEKPTFERFAETSLILFDLIARIKGKKNPKRPRLGWRKARITVGEPISVTQRWLVYQENRQSARQSVKELTADLQSALEKTIDR